jgi:hypothetical protein
MASLRVADVVGDSQDADFLRVARAFLDRVVFAINARIQFALVAADIQTAERTHQDVKFHDTSLAGNRNL